MGLSKLWTPRSVPSPHKPGFFGTPPDQRQILCAYEDSGKRFTLPNFVKEMGRRERRDWMRANQVVPAIQGGAYSMFEMLQPFQVANAVAVTAIGNAAVSQDLIFTIPANTFAFPGKILHFHCSGIQSNVVTTPGTYTWGVYWGGTAGTVLRSSGAIPPSTVATTSSMWYMDFWMKARATGALTTSLTLHCYGQMNMSSASIAAIGTAVATNGTQFMPPYGTTMAADVSSLDQTVPKAITLAVNPSVATGSVTMTDGWITAFN